VKPATIEERFTAFHEKNPWVFRMLESLTNDLVARGRTRIGLKMLVEVLRWQYWRQTDSDEPFKLPNEFTSRYARLLIAEHPEWDGMFRLHRLTAA
jgi:hypothetical protein